MSRPRKIPCSYFPWSEHFYIWYSTSHGSKPWHEKWTSPVQSRVAWKKTYFLPSLKQYFSEAFLCLIFFACLPFLENDRAHLLLNTEIIPKEKTAWPHWGSQLKKVIRVNKVLSQANLLWLIGFQPMKPEVHLIVFLSLLRIEASEGLRDLSSFQGKYGFN